uniref:Uncharacterized protein n=1 Tax=Utricularia reniformis TaxID=192314 RepID=A0A1Y0B4P3_9LAMI|nr:hypothetical protein AEK19_MT2213 [Utricularia reniformis]ART32358.1 hypothetical protein AEK19_MT2213 [Utricularia reniformis]
MLRTQLNLNSAELFKPSIQKRNNDEIRSHFLSILYEIFLTFSD